MESAKSYIPKDLRNCQYVWVRIDRIRRPLEAPYSGPYLVVSRGEKYFELQLPTGEKRHVSIDRLKPVYMLRNGNHRSSSRNSTTEQEHEPQITTPVENHKSDKYCEPIVKTRSGRRVRFKRHDDFVY